MQYLRILKCKLCVFCFKEQSHICVVLLYLFYIHLFIHLFFIHLFIYNHLSFNDFILFNQIIIYNNHYSHLYIYFIDSLID